MSLTQRQVAELERGLSIGSFERSHMGGMLDALEKYSVVERKVRPEDITARPTCEGREAPRTEPDGEQMQASALITKRLLRVAERDNEAAEALRCFYGDAGAMHSQGELGRLGAIMHLTDAGKRLAARTARKLRGMVDAKALIGAALTMQLTNPVASRAELIQQATVEALELKERAEAAYARVIDEQASLKRASSATKLTVVRSRNVHDLDDDDS